MTARNQMLVVVVAAAAAIAGYWFLVLTPKQEQAARLQEQITAKQTELETARREVASYEQARKSYRSNYAAVARLGKAVPADDDVRSLMVQIDSAARRSRVDFKSIDAGSGGGGAAAGQPALPPGVTLSAAGFGELPLTFSFTGSFFRLSDFVRRLDRFVTVDGQRIDVTGRLLQVQSLQLTPDAGKGFPAISAEVSATSYVTNSADDAATGATPQGPAGASTPAPAAPSSTTPPATTATVTGAVR